MEFDKDHKVKMSSLTTEEAKHFISFLLKEIKRHNSAVNEAVRHGVNYRAERPFWGSAIRRHAEDVVEIEALIETVRYKFSL